VLGSSEETGGYFAGGSISGASRVATVTAGEHTGGFGPGGPPFEPGSR
jgi:hypothetical protein